MSTLIVTTVCFLSFWFGVYIGSAKSVASIYPPPQYIYSYICEPGDYVYDTNGTLITPQCCNRKMELMNE